MSDKPVWLEKWVRYRYDGPGKQSKVVDSSEALVASVFSDESEDHAVHRSRLIAAAPALVRALLAVEWINMRGNDYPTCPECRHELEPGDGHSQSCALAAALASAGLHDQASRDEARRLMAESSKPHGKVTIMSEATQRIGAEPTQACHPKIFIPPSEVGSYLMKMCPKCGGLLELVKVSP